MPAVCLEHRLGGIEQAHLVAVEVVDVVELVSQLTGRRHRFASDHSVTHAM